jgi:two-component system, OmpR family, phosphate regulon sensor histidine kinase PhoR
MLVHPNGYSANMYWSWLLIGVLVVLWIWERFNAARLLRRLVDGTVRSLPNRGGVWGQIGDQLQKQFRVREEKAKQAESRLEEFLIALKQSPNGVILLDSQSRIEWCNETAASHLGLDMERDHLQTIQYMVRDPDFSAHLASWNYSREVVLSRSRPGGPPLRVALQVHSYAESRRLLLSRDVTALEQADAMRRDFVANVSHEIRTPLTVLAGFVETLQTLDLSEQERQRYLDLMSAQARRMQTLVSDLLTLSKLEGSRPPGLESPVDVHGLLQQCEQDAIGLSKLIHAADPHRIRLEMSGNAHVLGSGDELQSAVGNLMQNAVRYTPAGGAIVLSWTLCPDGTGEIAVKDSGVGIASEHLPRLTERFYRVDRSRSRETGGTGLGLSIVKHVTQRHGGELRIESEPGQGSIFRLRLPASRIRST